jgi:hypothetical protein
MCAMTGVGLSNVWSYTNKRHGIVIDVGNEVQRVNWYRSGMVSIKDTRSTDNGGHSLVVGAPSGDGATDVFRVRVDSLDTPNNGTDPTVLHADSNIFFRATEGSITNAGINCAGFAAGITMAGRRLFIGGEIRFVDPLTNCICVKEYGTFATYAVVIGQYAIIGAAIDSAVQAVVIDYGIAGVVFDNQSTWGAAITANPSYMRHYRDPITTVENVKTFVLNSQTADLASILRGHSTAGRYPNIQFQNELSTVKSKIMGDVSTGDVYMDVGTDRKYIIRNGVSGDQVMEISGRVGVRGIRFAAPPVYADNAAAVASGLVAGSIYRTATGELRMVLP